MDAYYQGTYRDEQGEEAIVIHSDGSELRTTIRGVEYVGEDFDEFVMPDGIIHEENSVRYAPGSVLSDYALAVVIHTPIQTAEGVVEGHLHYQITRGVQNQNGVPNPYATGLFLELNGQRYVANRKTIYWDELLPDIQKQFPKGWYFKACVNCVFSEVQPGGGPIFGAMGCFRNKKEEIVRIKNHKDPRGWKGAMFSIWQDKAQWVQEIYLCPKFERFIPDTDKDA